MEVVKIGKFRTRYFWTLPPPLKNNNIIVTYLSPLTLTKNSNNKKNDCFEVCFSKTD